MKRLLILLAAFLLLNLMPVFAADVSACGDLSLANETYYLNQSTNSTGTCFNITSNNVTLDCNGHTINYSQSTTGYGVNSTRYNYTKVRNCNIVQGSTQSNSYAIYYFMSSNGTIDNNTVMTSGINTYGIYLFVASISNTVSNNTVKTSGGYSHAIYLSSASNSNTISNNSVNTTNTYSVGIYLAVSSYSVITGNRMNATNSYAIIVEQSPIASHYNHTIDTTNTEQGKSIYYYFSNDSITVENLYDIGQLFVANSVNITIRNITMLNGDGIGLALTRNSSLANSIINISNYGIKGIYIYSSTDNTLSNNTIRTAGDYGYGIDLYLSSNNTILNSNVATSGNIGYGIVLSDSDNINITSCSLSASYSNIADLDLSGATNIKVINSTYADIAYYDTTDNLWRYWYLDVYVNGTAGISIQDANVTSWDKNNVEEFYGLTGTDGYVTRQIVPEYNQSASSTGYKSSPKFGGETYYTNYTVNATKSGYQVDSKQVNLTQSMGIYLTLTDLTNPSLSIQLPANTTYNFNTSLPLNFTVSDANLDKCWFNLDNEANTTLTSCANATFNASQGSHVLYIFANDTVGNENNTVTVSFTITTTTSTTTTTTLGGSSGGGATVTPHKFMQKWKEMLKGVVHKIMMFDKEIGFKQIIIEVRNNANNITITITKLAGQPATVVHNITGKVYQYMEIDHDNLNNSNLKSAKLRFNVTKIWINGNNFTKEHIYLNRYSNNVWEKLRTTIVGESSTEVEYEAETPGFSTFAITGEAVETTTTTIPIIPMPEVTTTTTTTVPVAPPETPSVPAEYYKLYMLILLLVIIAVLGWLYFHGNKKLPLFKHTPINE